MSTPISGLVSGFDWSTFIDSVISADSVPVTNLQSQQTTNTNKVTALNNLKTDFTSLQSAVNALNDPTLYAKRTAASTTSGSTWGISATSNTQTGSYTIAVSQLATATQINGKIGISGNLNATNDVSALTVASMSTATAVTAGIFTINGAQVNIATTDSLQQVFDKINSATTAAGSAVTGSYDPTTDTIKLSSANPIVLGAGNDTSNFLSVAKLLNNGTGTITSSGTLGKASLSNSLVNSHLKNAITAVDGSGNGSFSINGTSIAFNINSDSISSVMSKINNSAAGVTASYDTTNDRLVLTNKSTGSTGMSTSDVAGGFLDALGARGVSASLGKNAQYSVNGGTTLTSTSNTLDASSHGITGLSVTVDSETSQTVNVSNDISAAKTAINTFIAKYNVLQADIDTNTKITSSNGKVTTSTLSSVREVNDWAANLRSTVFSNVPGLSGAVQRMESMGIDFAPGSSQLQVKDSTKLDSALQNNGTDVQAFFTSTNTGFAAKLNTYINKVIGTGADNGELSSEVDTLNSSNTTLASQIDTLNRRLTAERATLTASFTAMESAISNNQSLQAQLTKNFG